MKYVIVCLVFLFGQPLMGQDTLFYNDLDQKVTSSEEYFYYKIIEYKSEPDVDVVAKSYYKNGTKKSVYPYVDFEKNIYHGTIEKYFENGNLKSEVEYVNGKKNGILKTYFEDGSLKRDDVMKDNELISGHFYNAQGEEIEHVAYEIMPSYPGGDQMMLRDLYGSMNYPAAARKRGIQGMVVVSFIVEKDGSHSEYTVVKSAHETLNEESIRAVKALKNFIPGYHDGEAVRVSFNIPIRYKLH